MNAQAEGNIMKRIITTTALAASLAFAGAASAAAQAKGQSTQTNARSPVIGCRQFSDEADGRVHWQSAPWDCTIGGPLGSIGGVAQVRWSGWGHRTATGHGQFVDGLGFYYPAATMTAYRLRTTYTGRKCYTRLHIVAPGAVRVRFRGPWNIYLDVTPE